LRLPFAQFRASPSRLGFIGIGLVSVIAFGSYLGLQTATENNLRQALLEQQMQRQIDGTNALADRISSDVASIVLRMQLLATEPVMQNGDLESDQTTQLLRQEHDELLKITSVESLAVLDENNILANTASADLRRFLGSDVSQREYATEVRERLQPYVSGSFVGLNGRLAFAVAVPIINRDSGDYVGALISRFELPAFFERYQSDLTISRIVAFDRNQVYVSTTIPELLGEDYWGEQVQTATAGNPALNAAYSSLFSGKPTSTIFVSGITHDERFVSGSPIFYQGEQMMSVVLTTPTAAIYSQVDHILFGQKIQTISALTGVVAAISILILYLSKWNRALDRKVKQRTIELETAYQKLEKHDKLQSEFINIAAHELRTPVQPLLGVADMLEITMKDADKIEVSRPEIEMIIRNAKRLERLSSDILEVSRIESDSLKLNKEDVDLNQKILHAVEDVKSFIPAGKQIRIIADLSKDPLFVYADKSRLFEVISNLIRNAIRFTESGTITIRAVKQNDGNIIVRVVDTGSGIDSEIMPRLFTKFASKSDSGTGLGLFICKSIIEAHGGKIWGENNRDGRGATFAFTLTNATAASNIESRTADESKSD
jgi:signal transduction histidine kinase